MTPRQTGILQEIEAELQRQSDDDELWARPERAGHWYVDGYLDLETLAIAIDKKLHG